MDRVTHLLDFIGSLSLALLRACGSARVPCKFEPPPVESPWLVPDFADAWTEAYNKAKAKVCSRFHNDFQMVASCREIVPRARSPVCLAEMEQQT